MSVKDKKRLINELEKHDIEIPKQVVLEEIYEQVRGNVLYICQMIDDSSEQEEGISDYVYEYLCDGVLFGLDEETLVEFANGIYLYTEKIKMRLLNINNVFDDDDWFELKVY